MLEQDNHIATIEGAKEATQLSIGEKLKKGLALASTVIAIAGSYAMAKDITSPNKASAEMECTTSTTTTEVNGVITTTETTECNESSDSSDPSNPTQPQQPSKTPKPPKPENNHPKPDKDKKKESREDEKRKQANSQKGFPGYDMGSSSFTDGNGCFITAAASSLRRETGNENITPKKIYYPALRQRWSPSGGVNGFLFDALPSMAEKHNVKVYDTNFKGALRAKKNGDEVMILAAPGHFTGVGHYMAVRGVTNNGRKLILDDPNGKGRNGDSERKSGWNARQLRAGGVIDYRVLHLRGVK